MFLSLLFFLSLSLTLYLFLSLSLSLSLSMHTPLFPSLNHSFQSDCYRWERTGWRSWVHGCIDARSFTWSHSSSICGKINFWYYFLYDKHSIAPLKSLTIFFFSIDFSSFLTFHLSFIHSSLPFYLLSFLLSFLPSFLPPFLSSFLPSLPPSVLSPLSINSSHILSCSSSVLFSLSGGLWRIWDLHFVN